mmetsp:Transcript_54144/g.118036  ORF Transcript_54144/g.118036 Transcript_54144/m.118036 type:complete len:368 (-) Transcript_54144:19-1122(-)
MDSISNTVQAIINHLSHVGVGRRSGKDTALAGTVVDVATTLEEDVSVHAPAGSPGVLDLVVVGTIGPGAVSDGEDTVVEFSTARVSHDTRLVHLESGLVGLDGDRHGLLGKRGHKGIIGVGLDISVGLDVKLGVNGAGGLEAGAVHGGGAGGVRVVSLRAEASVALDVREGTVHQATVASRVSDGVARHQLLLGETGPGRRLGVLLGVGTLEGTGGGERPAGAALALILDGGHNAGLGGPVHGGGQGGHILRGGVGEGSGLLIRDSQAQAHVGNPLVIAHVGELVVAKGVALAHLVVGLDHVLVVGEVLEEVGEVLSVLDGGLVLLNPVVELGLVERAVTEVGGGSAGQDGSDDKFVHFALKDLVKN